MKKCFTWAILAALSATPAYASIINIRSTDISPTGMYWFGGSAPHPRGVTAGAIYSDVSRQTSAFRHGEAATGALRTKMVADNITMTSASSAVTKITTTLFNYNASSSSSAVRFRVRFYGMDGTAGGPGTLLGGFDSTSNLACPGGGFVCQYTFNFDRTPFSLPQSFWAGISFDTGGTGIVDPYGGTASPLGGNFPGATLPTTAAQLNNLGEGIFSGVNVGSSTDVMFMTTGTDIGGFSTNSPAGGGYYFGGNPVANTGWEFVPEPTTLALLIVSGVFLARRRRRAVR